MRRTRLAHMALLIALVSCERQPGERATGQSGEFATLVARYAEGINDYPKHVQAEEARRKLVEAVEKEEISAVADPRIVVMKRLSNSGLALALAKEISSELERDLPEKAKTFYEDLVRDHGNEAIGALACDRLLVLSRKASEADFLSWCQKMIQTSENTKAKSIALLRRAEYLDSPTEIKSSVMDSLRYWTLYPEKVELSGLALVFLGRLERAGFVLEAGMLEAARNPGRVAETILSDLEALMLSQGSSETTAARDPNVAYAKYTPEIEQVLSLVDLNRAPSKFAKVAYLARMSRLQIDHLDSEGTNQMLIAYLAEVEMRLNEKDLAEEQLSSLGLMNLALCRASEKFFGESGFARTNGDPSARPPVRKATSGQLLSRLSETQNALLRERADRAAARGPEAMQEVIDELLDFAQHMSNQKGVVEAYGSIIDRFPESPYACRALLALGKHYEEEMKSPVLAVKAYKRIVTAFPKTSEAVEAQLRSMISLCQSQKYAEAYAVAQEFLTDPPQEKIPIAKMISALSEAGLGLADDAKAHMEQIVEKYPQSDLAPRCLLWLGSEALGSQSYAEALGIFQDLSERYPESSYAKQAREYMGRLAKVAGSQ